MRTALSLVASLLFGTVLAINTPSNAAAQNFTELDQPVPMPEFRLPGLNGSTGSDADLRNKVTVIRFWASW